MKAGLDQYVPGQVFVSPCSLEFSPLGARGSFAPAYSCSWRMPHQAISKAGQGQGRAGQGRARQGRAGRGRAGQDRAGFVSVLGTDGRHRFCIQTFDVNCNVVSMGRNLSRFTCGAQRVRRSCH